jgi:hypothetical protein
VLANTRLMLRAHARKYLGRSLSHEHRSGLAVSRNQCCAQESELELPFVAPGLTARRGGGLVRRPTSGVEDRMPIHKRD